MRGKAEPVNMNFETLQQALKDVTSIDTVTFTGGEPALNVSLIEHFTEYVRFNKIPVNAFFVITNGKIASKSLKSALTTLSWWCDSQESCNLSMSQDQFHVGYNQARAMALYENLPFFHSEARKDKIQFVIDEGLASQNGIGISPPKTDKPIICTNKGKKITTDVEGPVYINVYGDVIPSCDISYKSQEIKKLGNVYEKPLLDILQSGQRVWQVA
jgi:organic radical activating enzyme